MDSHLRTVKQLVAADMYIVDPVRVADAILARAEVRAAVANVVLRPAARPGSIRSFRRDDSAASFRLRRSARRHPRC